MLKKIMFMLLLLILSGCTRIRNDDKNYVNYVDFIFSENKIITNSVSLGYKYYVPKGVRIISNNDFNIKFMAENTYLYLYVDVVSYYNKKIIIENNIDSFDYYKELKNGNKKGYIIVDKKGENSYFVKIVYNYAKIEFYSTNDKISKLITLSSIVLKNIDYNDLLIKKILENSSISTGEITYQIDDLKQSKSNFSQYLNEFVKEEEKKNLPDE